MEHLALTGVENEIYDPHFGSANNNKNSFLSRVLAGTIEH